MSQSGGAAWTRDASLKTKMYESLVGSVIVSATSMPSIDSGQKIVPLEKSDRTNHLYPQNTVDYSAQPHQGFGFGTSDSQRLGSAYKAPTNCLWLGGLDPAVHHREDLRTFFSGWPGFCDISMPENGGYFAFATFETVEDAIEAKNFIACKYHFFLCGKSIKVNFGRQTTPVVRNELELSRPLTNIQATATEERKSKNLVEEAPNMEQEEFYDEDSHMQSTIQDIVDQEHVINENISYYDDPIDERELNRNEIDEIVEKVDHVRRSSGREELRDCLKRKRAKSRKSLEVILKRIVHLYSHDIHKKLVILYAVGDFFYCLPPHRRYNVGEAIGEDIVEFLSTILAHQCDKGRVYIGDVAASLYFYFLPAVRKQLEMFIDIEVLIDLKQDEVITKKPS